MRKSSLVTLAAALSLSACATPEPATNIPAVAPPQLPLTKEAHKDRCHHKIDEFTTFLREIQDINHQIKWQIYAHNEAVLAEGAPNFQNYNYIVTKIKGIQDRIDSVLRAAGQEPPFKCPPDDYDRMHQVVNEIKMYHVLIGQKVTHILYTP